MKTAFDLLSDLYVSVSPDTSIGKAVGHSIENDANVLLVISADKQLVGTLEDGIALRSALDSHLRQDPVSLHISRRCASVSSAAPLDVVLDQFVLHNLHFLPVVDVNGFVEGVILRQDLLSAVYKHNSEVSIPSFS